MTCNDMNTIIQNNATSKEIQQIKSQLATKDIEIQVYLDRNCNKEKIVETNSK